MQPSLPCILVRAIEVRRSTMRFTILLQIFDSVHAAIGRYPHKAEIALTSHDAKRLKNLQKRAIFIGIENGYPIGTDLSRLDLYYNLGARYLTLCHT